MAEARAVLAMDVGNSGVSMARVVGEAVSDLRRIAAGELPAAADAMAEIWERTPAPKCVAVSSVCAGNLEALEPLVRERLDRDPLVVGRELPLPIETDLPEPSRVGTDRLCSAAMAWHRLRQACVVADFGTAVTVDCVSGEGVFLGGAILPGLGMGAEALARGTSALPKVALARPDWVFGKTTVQAIVGGLVHGARGALRALTEAYATELGQWPLLIVTGGDAGLVAVDGDERDDLVHAVVPHLCLMGVALAAGRGRAGRP